MGTAQPVTQAGGFVAKSLSKSAKEKNREDSVAEEVAGFAKKVMQVGPIGIYRCAEQRAAEGMKRS